MFVVSSIVCPKATREGTGTDPHPGVPHLRQSYLNVVTDEKVSQAGISPGETPIQYHWVHCQCW